MPVLPKDEFQGITADVWWIDEVTNMPNLDPDEWERIKRAFRDAVSTRDWRQTPVYNTTRDSFSDTWEPGQTRPSISRPTYNTRPSFQPPGFFIVQYIGGARNGLQEYLEYAKYKLAIVEGGAYSVILPSPSPTISPDGLVSVVGALRAVYTLTFIPRDQTPFAESAQVVIALFKE